MKKLTLILIVILSLFFIASVNATNSFDNNLTEDNDTGDSLKVNTFSDLSQKINDTPENQTLTLNEDYFYCDEDVHGIVISKSITVDGAGHTIEANHSSRIFNITADNVILKNINFVNGNALGKYFTSEVGGGAIFWSGNNGKIMNCNFTNNTGNGIEDDPFDKEETLVSEDGMVTHIIRFRPMGTRINEGGAISWRGENGVVSNCLFVNNHAGYPNGGGAICWRGNNGKIIDSVFLNNGAWLGSAVEWRADNGMILSSKFNNSGLTDNGIYWSGKNGTVKNSILISSDGRRVISGYSDELSADFNYWGDNMQNPNEYPKPDNVKYWYVSTLANLSFDELVLNCSFILLKIASKIDARIISKDLKVYYKSNNLFKIQVFDNTGNVASYQDVTFNINNHEYYAVTDGEGYATLKIKEEPGKYTVFSQYQNIIVKNKITIKSTLITKNLSKKVKKSANFKIKVLNSKDKAFKKQTVKVKFRGKTYKIKTNKMGIATFKIPKNLKVGKYTVKTTYNGLTNSNKIIVKK